MAKRWNDKQLSLPGGKKITRQSLHDAVRAKLLTGNFHPVIMGCPAVVPEELTKAITMHAIMMQVSG